MADATVVVVQHTSIVVDIRLYVEHVRSLTQGTSKYNISSSVHRASVHICTSGSVENERREEKASIGRLEVERQALTSYDYGDLKRD